MNLGDDRRELVEIELPDGRSIWVSVAAPGGIRDVGARDIVNKVSRVLGFHEAVEWIGSNLSAATATLRPDRVSVEFGMELAYGKGGLIAAIGGVSGKTSIKVTLGWGQNPTDPPAATPAQPA